MRKIATIAIREYIAATRTKGFIIGLLLAPVLMGGGFIAMYLFGDQNDMSDRTILVVDQTRSFTPALIEAAARRNADLRDPDGIQVRSAFRIETVEPATDPIAQRVALSDRIRRERIHGFLEIREDGFAGDSGESRFRYFSDKLPIDGVKEWVTQTINEEIRRRRLAELGLDPGVAENLFAWQSVDAMEPVAMGRDGTVEEVRPIDQARTFGVPMGMCLLTFMLVMIGATPLLNSVMEEKTQGIAEVVLGSASPFQFMMGKVLGMLGVSLTASVVYVSGGIFAMMNAGMAGLIPFRILPWFLVFIVLAILMVGSLMAGLGAACSDAKDAQNLALPGLMPLVIPLFLLVPVLQDPTGTFATSLSLFPLFTPVLMIMRLSTTAAIPLWQPWAGLLGVVLTTVLMVWAGGRIFRVGILMQGQPPRLGNLIRWLARG